LRREFSADFSEARAWPFTEPHPFNTSTLGERSALPIQTQSIGNAFGGSVADRPPWKSVYEA